MRKFALYLSAAALMLGSAASAYAKPVGTMTCNNLPSFNVSGYTFGLESGPSGSPNKQAGASTTFYPLDVHTSLTQFATFLKLDAVPKALRCTLIVSGNDGSSVTFEFNNVMVQSVTVTASSGTKKDEEKAAYTDVVLSYGQIAVASNSGGDDGGSTPIDPGWSTVKNNPGLNPGGPLLK